MALRMLFLTLFVFIITLGSSHAQYGLTFTNLEFRGDYAQVFKPALVPELSYYISEMDDEWQAGAKIGFTILPTRQDTFFNYAIQISQGSTVLPAYEIYEQVKYIPLSFFYAYMPLESSLRPVMGISVNADILIYNYQKRVETLVSSSEQNKSHGIIGLMPFIGGSYQFNDLLRCQIDVGHQFAIDTNRSKQRLWRTSLSVIYYFY